MTTNMNRRQFLESTVAAGAFTIVPRHVLGGSGQVAPSDKITFAHIGMGTQSIRELGGLLEEPSIQIVAICDPNTDSSDYVEWGKHEIKRRIQGYLENPSWRENDNGCPGGREVGREIVETYYAKQRSAVKFNGCRIYDDFRELLEKEKDVDAVKIMTPDHLHAAIAIAAMKKGLHVLMHKPIANRLYEGRLVLETARQTKVSTHLLAYGSGAANGKIVEQIKKGVIGPLREIHNWTNRPVWPQYTEISVDRPPVPKGFNWDLWLGPSQFRPYHPAYTHTVYRGWYEFGGGSMADMGIYSLWPVFTGLDLQPAQSAQAWATHTCHIADHVSRTTENDFAYPTACSQRFRLPAGEYTPELDLFWYDGGMKPRLPIEIEALDIEMEQEGILFLGDKGAIFADFRGANPRLLADGQNNPLPMEDTTGQEERRNRRENPWLAAFLAGEQSPGSFLNAAAITDTVNLGTVALRAGKKVLFDSEKMQITNDADANAYLYREYREGWEL
ncbi:Gfo/Idh/MocA family oxidoreductase [candidate division KSB1 bacterium]|nr:Gfo/Idh/MocA family oxidoreductase [candidate division KSB1 bacterium]